jgi:hypothetical protein
MAITFGPGISVGPGIDVGDFAISNKAIFGYGYDFGPLTITNKVSNTGVVADDVDYPSTTGREQLAGAGYGGDKGIFGYGDNFGVTTYVNKVSNTGIVEADQNYTATQPRYGLAAAGYGGDKAIFGYGYAPFGGGYFTITNKVSNTGVVDSNVTNASTTARGGLAAAGYGGDKAIFGYGTTDDGATVLSMTNLVTNTGVVGNDVTGVGTARYLLAAAGYGGDKAIFGYGSTSEFAGYLSITNLVSNTGTVQTDTTGVGTARNKLAAATYGDDKAIFGYGFVAADGGTAVTITNLVSNTGVVAGDTTGVGTARFGLAAATFG